MEWKILTIEDRDRLKRYFNKELVTSDLNFTNIYIWSESEGIEYLIDNDTLIIKGVYDDKEYFLPPLTEDNDSEKILKGVEKIVELGGREIIFIPELYYPILKDRYNLKDVRDSYDYIYLQEDLATLKGRKYSAKKNKVNQFKRNYHFNFEKIDESSIEEIREFQREWVDERKMEKIILGEHLGIENILNNYRKLELIGGVLKVDGKVVGYSIGEIINDEYGVIHIEKGDSNYQGVYQAINLFTSQLFEGIKYLNREDDFGDSGLRKAKESYLPYTMLKKYSIEL